MRSLFFLISIVLLTATGCNKIFEKPSWETDIKAPLITTSLSIKDIIRDTARVKTEADNSIKIVSREQLYELNVDSLVQLEVTPFTKNVKLSTLMLATQTITDTVSLGRLAKQMQAQGNPTGDFIIDNHGNTIIFPGMSNLTVGPLDVNIQQFFEEATIQSGTMDITIKNELPINITNLDFELRNKINQDIITQQNYANLNSGTSQTKTQDLAGKTIEGIIQVNVTDMDLPFKFNVPIDTSDALIITLTVSNIMVSSATAVFPAQDVVDEKYETSLQGLGDMELIKAIIDSGAVEADAYSTAEDTVYFSFKIPYATRNGQPFIMNAKVPPAPPGGTVYAHFETEFNGYEMDLQGFPQDTFNTFYSELKGRIEYTGVKKHLTLTDSFYVTVNLINAKPKYVSGYFGRDTLDVASGSFNIDVFKNIESGSLNFETANVKLVVENGLGLDGEIKVNTLQAVNTKTGQVANITAPVTGPIFAATDNPLTSVTSTVALNSSDAVNLLNVLPDKILYDAELIYNATADGVRSDFAYKGVTLKPYLEIELPLSVIANDLVLSDTAEFLSDKFKTSVNRGTFTVQVANGFPVGGDLKLYFLDEGNTLLDSVISIGGVLPAQVDASNKVIGKEPSSISFYIDESRMQNILRSRKVVFKVGFSTTATTTPPNSYVKIYSDYSIDFKLVGDFNYTVK